MIRCSLEHELTILLVSAVYLSFLLAFWLLTKKHNTQPTTNTLKKKKTNRNHRHHPPTSHPSTSPGKKDCLKFYPKTP